MIPALNASNIYSTLGNPNSLVPMAVKDIANSCGLTAGSYIAGDKLEGKDRFIDEFGTQAIWLFGIPAYKKIIDWTLYKALKIDPAFDVRNLKDTRKNILEKSIQYADNSIKESMKTASKNQKFTKNLAMGKFIVSTALTILSYAGLTKYRHQNTKKNAEKEILAELAAKQPGSQAAKESGKWKVERSNNFQFSTFNFPTDKVLSPYRHIALSPKDMQPSFTGNIQDFMYNPVKNLMILDASITTERLAHSRNKQDLIGYTIKEGTFWAFMYFASKPIQKFFEKRADNNTKKPVSIDLDARVIESKELEKAISNGTLKLSTEKILKLETQEQLLDFIHNNPDDFTVQMAKKSDVLPILKNAAQADNVDYRRFIDLDEFKGVAEKLSKLNNKFEQFKLTDLKDKSLEAFLKNVKKVKRASILKNMGACIGVLGVLAPAIMVLTRKMDKENQGFQVKEDLKKQMAFNGKLA